MTATRKFVLLLLAIIIALPLSAATPRRRTVQLSPGSEAEVTGTITDSATGQPVVAAQVESGRLRTTTDAAGKYKITLPSGRTTVLTVKRTGYQPTTFSLTPAGPTTRDLTLTGNPTVSVLLTNGTRYQLDAETSQFAYLVPLSGYAKSDVANFCRADGSAWAPDKSELKKITGPGVSTSVAACCPNLPVIVVNVETKAGATAQVSMKDSCIGYEVDFIGRNHVTADYQYMKWTDIAEVVFP